MSEGESEQYTGKTLEKALSTRDKKRTRKSNRFPLWMLFGCKTYSTKNIVQYSLAPCGRGGRGEGFTLAEVLITLGIIGIVAAMTLPTVLAKYEKKETVTRLKRAYSLINQAFKMAEVSHGEISEWPDWDNAEKILKEYIAPTMKVQKFYPPNSNSTRSMCYELINGKNWAYHWFNNTGISSPFYAGKTASMRLPDGICIGLNPEIQKENDDEYNPAWGANVFVDVNGAKGPNIAGYDLFFFVIVGNAIKPYGYNLSPEKVSSTSVNACNLAAGNGGYMCAARIMNEGWEIKYR